MRPIPNAIIVLIIVLGSAAHGATVLDFWHQYTPPAGEPHFSFHLTNFKRGVFVGSCGPSAKSMQWSFNVDLNGSGPVYEKDQIRLSTEDGQEIAIVSGTISVDAKQKKAVIRLMVVGKNAASNFAGNGTFPIKRLR